MDNVRAQFFKDKLTKGADVTGAAEAKPQFDINQVYKNYSSAKLFLMAKSARPTLVFTSNFLRSIN